MLSPSKGGKSNCLNKLLNRTQGCFAATQAGVTCHLLSRCKAPSAMPRASERLGHQPDHGGLGRTRPTFARTCHAIPRCRSRKVSHLATQLPPRRLLGQNRTKTYAQTPEDTLSCAQRWVPTPAQKAEICEPGAVRFDRQRRSFVHQETRQSAGICAVRNGGDVNYDARSLKSNDHPH